MLKCYLLLLIYGKFKFPYIFIHVWIGFKLLIIVHPTIQMIGNNNNLLLFGNKLGSRGTSEQHHHERDISLVCTLFVSYFLWVWTNRGHDNVFFVFIKCSMQTRKIVHADRLTTFHVATSSNIDIYVLFT